MQKIIFAILLSVFFCNPIFAAQEPPTYTEAKLAVMVNPSQPRFFIQLKSNPTTGYSWFLSEYNDKFIAPVAQHYEAPKDKRLMGASGFQVWEFTVKPEAFAVPHQMTLHFVYARPWSTKEKGSEVVFKISTFGNNEKETP